MRRTYLDHAATTEVAPAARAAMAEAWARWANPSSQHREGRAARAALEEARARIKAALGWPHELIFTSGATEAAAIALTRTAGRPPAVVSAVEHAAVLRQRADAAVVAVDGDGLVAADALAALLRDRGRAVVAIQHVNSETGVVQPLGRLAEAVAAAGGVLFADCAQSAGKLPLPPADLVAVSAHKLGGPPGIGALLVRDLRLLEPSGQGQEQGYRAGTENLPAALGFAAAVAAAPVAGAIPDWVAERHRWRRRLDQAVRDGGGAVVCDRSPRHALIASYRMPGMRAAAQLIGFDAAGFAVSAGSACSSGVLGPNPVLAALGLAPETAGEVVRVSFGATTTRDEVERFARCWDEFAAAARRRAA